MHRREAIRTLAAFGVAASVAGCTASRRSQSFPRPPQEPEGKKPEEPSGDSLRVDSIDYREGESGNLVAVVTVVNDGDRQLTETLSVTVTVEKETTTESTDVTVDSDGTKAVELPFSASFEAFEQSGSIKLSLDDADGA